MILSILKTNQESRGARNQNQCVQEEFLCRKCAYVEFSISALMLRTLLCGIDAITSYDMVV